MKYKYSVQQYQVYTMLVRGRTWYLYVLVYLVGYRPTAVCAFIFFDGRFDTPGAMTRCNARNTCCMVHMGHFAWNSSALRAMSFLRARWSIWRYWGNVAPLKRTPWGSWSQRTPRMGHVLGERTPHEFLRIYCWTEYRASNKKLETGPAWNSYSRMEAFYTKLNITTPETLVFLQVSARLSCRSFS